MQEKLKKIREEAIARLTEAGSAEEINEIRVAFLGKKGALTEVLKGMRDVAPEDRPKVGQMVNETRAAIEKILEEGALKASAIANNTLDKVEKKIGLEIKYQ